MTERTVMFEILTLTPAKTEMDAFVDVRVDPRLIEIAKLFVKLEYNPTRKTI